jgi:adenylate cyclase class 2
MLEIEVKYQARDLGAVEKRLESGGAKRVEKRDDADAYFNAPHKDFAATDEALRVRRIGEQNFVTYKGPRIDTRTKTRSEIEVPLANGSTAADDFERILTALGFRPTAVVRKQRMVHELERGGYTVQVCLDQVAEVGNYVELEIMADEAHLERAREVVLSCAAELGLTQIERRSYLELLLNARGLA